jgi:O-antigen/teichoic acid export membrane protein
VIGGHVLVYLKGIIVMPIIIKSVGVTTYGGFVLLTSVLGMAFMLSSLGTGVTARRYLPSTEDVDARRRLFYPPLTFNVIIVLALSAIFAALYPRLRSQTIPFSAWGPPLYVFCYLLYSQGSDYFRYTSRIHYMTLANVCFPYIDIAVTLAFLYAYGTISINLLLLSTSIAAFIVGAPLFVMILRELGPHPVFYEAKGLVADAKRGGPLVLNNIVDFILASSDRYLIALYLSVTDVGYYVPGYVLGSAIIFLPKAIGTAFPQMLSRAVDSGMEAEGQTMLNYTIKIFMLLAIPFVFGCAALGKPILALLANADVADRARIVAPVVALGTLFYGLTLLLANALFVRLKTNAMFQVNLLAGLSNLAANVVLLYFFRNILIAAFTTLLSYFIAFAYGYVVVGRDWRIDYGLGSIAKSIVASIVMAVVLAAVMSGTPDLHAPAVAALCALGVVVYVTGLLALRTFSGQEVLFLRRLLA